jgi:hypothetical protein
VHHPASLRHHSCPPGRSWPRDDAVFQVFLDAFQTCCKLMFQVFQLFPIYVLIVSCICCKSGSRCCICCNACLHMFQASIPNVSSVFYTHMLQVFLTHVSSVPSVFFYVLEVLHLDISKVERDVCTCYNGVSIVCCKSFICFRRMLQKFHLDVAKVDRGVAQSVRCLSLCEARGGHEGVGPCDGREHRCWGAGRGMLSVRRNADAGVAQVS